MGKTFVALAVARAAGETVILAPAALRSMWLDALRRASVRARVESYEAVSRAAVRLQSRPKLLVLDEAHHARNPSSRRYQALADLAWGVKVLLLSATPVHNRAADLHAVLALFLGSQAYSLSPTGCTRYIVRRAVSAQSPWLATGDRPVLPALSMPRWLQVAPDEDTFRAIQALPPAVPPSDGGVAHGLLMLGLIRAWCSSTAALQAMLRRRLHRATALLSALEQGRHPTRAELSSWISVDGAVQLAFPGLVSRVEAPQESERLVASIMRHDAAVRGVLSHLEGDERDALRARHLLAIRDGAEGDAVVAFTQFTETATALYRACSRGGGVALVTGRGARIASGRISPHEVVTRFDVDGVADPRMPLDLLVAGDVLSEGLSLRRARILVHLDLPWTMARLEQRVGRIRRIGSPHHTVSVCAIGPPIGARALGTVVRALQRKSRLATALGTAPPPDEQPMAGIALDRATRRIVKRGESDAVERIRSELTTWLDPSVDSGNPPGDIIGVLCVPPGRVRGWRGLALVKRDGRPILVGASAEGITERAVEVLEIVQLVGVSSAGTNQAATRGAVLAFRSVLDQWLDRCRATALIAPVTVAPSAAHTNLLRFLDGIMTGVDRSALAQLRSDIERCRAAVLASRGIGAELALERWLHGQGDDAGRDVTQRLEGLLTMLEERNRRRDGTNLAEQGARLPFGGSSIAALVLTGGP
jgi:hypothetical protein